MVLDWQKQIEECIELNQLVFDPFLTKTGKDYLRTLVAKHLLEQGLSDEEVKDWFKNNDTQDFEVYGDNFEDMVLNVARACKWPKERKWEVYITQDEISFINGLECKLECKKYLFGVLCCAKFNKIKTSLPVFNHSQHGYAWYLVTGNYDFTEKRYLQNEIKKFMDGLKKQKLVYTMPYSKDIFRTSVNGGRHRVKVTNTTLQGPWINFEATEGYKLTNDVNEIKAFADEHIFPTFSICPYCKRKFLSSDKAKTPLCLGCYNKKRRRKEQARLRKFAQNKAKNKKKSTQEICT